MDAARLLAANEAANAGQWMSYGRDYAEQRFSPLKSINTETVKNLGSRLVRRLRYPSRPGVHPDRRRWRALRDDRLEQGLRVRGEDRQTTAGSSTRRCRASAAVYACCDVVNRGVAAWNGKVYVGTIDGRLIALDAASGKSVWDVLTIEQGRRRLLHHRCAPRVVKGMVLIGQGGAEYSVRGYVTAYRRGDRQAMIWRWYTVPGDPSKGRSRIRRWRWPPRPGAATGGKTGGGGTVWDAITYDPKTNLLFIGTGNGGPWPAEIRDPGGKGDHLFLSSIVALKPDTGEYVWHYQQVQRDSWDYTAVQQITVADLKIDGKDRHVIMQAPKNGYFYVLDAASGELISAKPIVSRLNWSSGIDMKTGRPIMNPAARYDVTGKGFIAIPHYGGAHSWPPMSFSPHHGARVHPDDGDQLSVRARARRRQPDGPEAERSASPAARRCCRTRRRCA